VLGHARHEEVDLSLARTAIATGPLVGAHPVHERLGKELVERRGDVLRGIDRDRPAWKVAVPTMVSPSGPVRTRSNVMTSSVRGSLFRDSTGRG
jgi:hypothetical protein